MSTKAEIRVSGVVVQVVHKKIKNLHLGVYPPHGKVRVAAPMALSDDAVRLAIVGKLGWIKRQKAKFDAQPRLSKREMVSGESHYYLGRRYRLRVIAHQGPGNVALSSNALELHVRPTLSADQREKVLQQWYREQLRALIPPLLEKWRAAGGVSVSDWGIRRMKTKWGSCNHTRKSLRLNTDLAKKPPECLEYIVVHEMIHLLHPTHNSHFMTLTDQFMPKWRFYRDQLNQLPVKHENWAY